MRAPPKGNDMSRERVITDPIEKIIADALDEAGIPYICGGDPGNEAGLDFFLPIARIYIECKAYDTPRTAGQMARAQNVIVVQGRGAADLFASMLVAVTDEAGNADTLPRPKTLRSG
jgi:hypothetical protein